MRIPYVPVKLKFAISIVLSILWGGFSYWIAERWLAEVSAILGPIIANAILFGIAIIPGIMNAFIITSLLLDKRPPLNTVDVYPPITILIAAYNESQHIYSTLESISRQDYPGKLTILVVNDGSTDDTEKITTELMPKYPWLSIFNLKKNVGKAEALNQALKQVKTELVLTVDGDSYLYKNALKNVVARMLSDPAHTKAVAGAVLVRNSRQNLITKIQEWDYFHGIAAVKRMQSLYQGTLVAQGAFSIYNTEAVREVGAWPNCVGEDIVLTWALLKKGYRVGFAENAVLFTHAPDTWSQFIKQRHRWSRGLIEAFKHHWQLLFKPLLITNFIWWNLFFPFMDIMYTFAFIPGVIAALVFKEYLIVGWLTLLVLPLSMVVNYIMFHEQNKMFKEQGLKVRDNLIGFLMYSLFYSFVLQPACVFGYIKEIFWGSIKDWGTKK